ncbi:MAG: c-type cytochrome, partial [Methyloligellaceae bacterium]
MKRVMTHPLLLSALAILGLYVVFAYLLDPPMPRSLLIQYMVICVVGILMVATFSDATAKRLAEPIVTLLGDPKYRIARGAALAVAVFGAGGVTYGIAKPKLDQAPIEQRTVHPAPPSTIKVYGKTYDLRKLENPLRKTAAKGSDGYKSLVSEGATLYYKNCLYCHGDILDGAGHFATGLNPRPANFQDVGTIAQLQESYLFWRITTGAPGLPREGAPWASAMPVWREMLKEDEVWKIILFLYDYTGHEPRSWELVTGSEAAEAKGEPAAKTEKTGADSSGEDAIQAVYKRRCAHCHGDEGDGQGPAAQYMYPKPRDFTLSLFKYKTTHADNEFPTDEDLKRTIEDGLSATAMPGWKGILSDAEIAGLIKLIKTFGGWEEEELELKPIDQGQPVPSSPESIKKGAELFTKACVQCHGPKGRGNITSGKKIADDWEDRIWPRNLTRPDTWRVTKEARHVFQRISTGIRGTPMPEHSTTMKVEDRWHVANYVMTLRKAATPTAKGETVLRGVQVRGALPAAPDDPAWEKAAPITFPLIPNIIKEPRLFFSLNDSVTVRALFNGEEIAIRLDIDDRTYSVPGDELEKRYRIEGVAPTPDAASIQFPATIPTTMEKPWFRHGDRGHPVNMWFWRAPSAEPKKTQSVLLLDASGPEAAPRPRRDHAALSGVGSWKDGQWRIVLKRALRTKDTA